MGDEARLGEVATIGRSALAEQVGETLRALIMDQVLAPKQRLNITLLARKLGVSETPVREALSRLRAERLVDFEPYVGYTVMPLPTLDRLRELLEVRMLLESHAAVIGAPQITDAQIEQMRNAVEGMEHLQAGPTFRESKDFNTQDRSFHSLIVQAAGNKVLIEAYESLNLHIVLARLYHGRGLAEIRLAQRDHRAILQAYERRDSQTAKETVIAHIDGAHQRLAALLQQLVLTSEQSHH